MVDGEGAVDRDELADEDRGLPLARRALSGNAADAPAQAYDTTEWDELQKKHGNLEGVELGSDRCEKARVQDARGISKDGCTADLC